MKVKRIRGTRDFIAEEADFMRLIYNKCREVLNLYGYCEVITPVMEDQNLFVRTVGETTDIVEKEMFSFKLKSGETVALRPEGTAPVARAYVENSLYSLEPYSRLYYMGPMFRYERPQRGRYRQFHQVGAELIGPEDAYADAEVIKLALELLEVCGVDKCELQINSVGCKNCRPLYVHKLREFLETHAQEICEECVRRKDRNPMRALDCKKDRCRQIYENAPRTVDNLCHECLGHFEEVQKYLKSFHIKFTVNPMIVRGLDYYTRTAFEIIHTGLGAQNAVSAGGRYDGLIGDLGGPSIPGVGFAMGVERVMEISSLLKEKARDGTGVLVMEKRFVEHAVSLVNSLRSAGIRCVIDYRFGSMKSQMRRLDKENVRYVVILGEKEMAEGFYTVKDLLSGEQREIPHNEITEYVRRKK